jgi:hypothetical protein
MYAIFNNSYIQNLLLKFIQVIIDSNQFNRSEEWNVAGAITSGKSKTNELKDKQYNR